MFVDASLLRGLTDINLKAFKEAKTDDKRAKATLNINKLKKAAVSITEAIKQVNTHKERMRRLILKEAAIE